MLRDSTTLASVTVPFRIHHDIAVVINDLFVSLLRPRALSGRVAVRFPCRVMLGAQSASHRLANAIINRALLISVSDRLPKWVAVLPELLVVSDAKPSRLCLGIAALSFARPDIHAWQ